MFRSTIAALTIAALASATPTPRTKRSIPVATDFAPLSKLSTKAPSSKALLANGYGTTKLIPADDQDAYAIDICFGGQTFSVILDTGSSDLWLPQEGFKCVNVKEKPVPLADCAWGPLHSGGFQGGQIPGENFNITYGDGEFLTGPFGYESVWAAGITVEKQEVALATYGYWSGDNVTSGLMGFAYPTLTSAYKGSNPATDNPNTTAVNYNPFIFNAIQQGAVDHSLFSLAIERGTNGVWGQLAIGGLPNIEFEHKFASSPIEIFELIPVAETAHKYSFYTITPESFTFGKPGALTTVKNTTPTIVDSGTTLIYLPATLANAINAAYDPPAKMIASEGVVEVDCKATAPEFSINIGGTDFVINPVDLILKGEEGYDSSTGLCLAGIQPGTEPAILGDVFLKNVVAVFDVGNSEMLFAPHSDY